MTQGQRDALFDTMMLHIPKDDPGCADIYELLAMMTNEDLNRIEPLIDRWNTEAFEAGKRFFRLKTEEQILKLGERA